MIHGGRVILQNKKSENYHHSTIPKKSPLKDGIWRERVILDESITRAQSPRHDLAKKKHRSSVLTALHGRHGESPPHPMGYDAIGETVPGCGGVTCRTLLQ
jgi:hypothetical protein